MTNINNQNIDFQAWDWLPKVAEEIEFYFNRLLSFEGIKMHSVAARAKSIASFQEKCARKQYTDPKAQVNDTVAARLIVYSNRDRSRVGELLEERFLFLEDPKNPAEDRPHERRGYDCMHYIISGEKGEQSSELASGNLRRYFREYGGLEVQVRTVASHAWAEFEHARRYKGPEYSNISDDSKKTVDQLLAAAADTRSSLDEIFVAIDRVLSNPSTDAEITRQDAETSARTLEVLENNPVVQEITIESMKEFLEKFYPNDKRASSSGYDFALQLAESIDATSINELESIISTVDSNVVMDLMDLDTEVTNVRRMDDDLLAAMGKTYIVSTQGLGNNRSRSRQLEWRFDRLRGKVGQKYRNISFVGEDVPQEFRNVPFTAARAVRELVKIIGDIKGVSATLVSNLIEREKPAVTNPARSRCVEFNDGGSVWVVTTLSRSGFLDVLDSLIANNQDLSIKYISSAG